MAAAPLISVVIPCYNQGHFLADAIASVWPSSAVPVEVVVVDDGSTDGTSAIAAASAGVRCVRQQNVGLSGARNRGLRETRGSYVVFLDADDRLAPGGLDIGTRAIDAHPDAAFVFGRCVMMSASGELLPTPGQPPIERDHYRELLRRNLIWMPAMAMFRRDALERAGGFNPAVNASADYELYLRLARTRPVHDHGQIVAYYRRHSGNMSGDAARMLRESLDVLRRERQLVGADPAALDAWRAGWRTWQVFYGTQLVNEIRLHVRARQWRRALRKALTLARWHPRGLIHHATRKLTLTVSGRPDE